MTALQPKPMELRYYGSGKLSRSAPVKIASSNLFIDDKPIPVDEMVGLVFEDFGALELIDSYSMDILSPRNYGNPMKNSDILRVYQDSRYEVPGTSPSSSSAVKLSDYVPDYGTGPDGRYVYFSNESDVYQITSVTTTNGSSFITYVSTHKLKQGDSVNITGMTISATNVKSKNVTSTTATSFTVDSGVAMVGTQTSTQSGTVYRIRKTDSKGDDGTLNEYIVIDIINLKPSEQIEVQFINDITGLTTFKEVIAP